MGNVEHEFRICLSAVIHVYDQQFPRMGKDSLALAMEPFLRVGFHAQWQ